MKAELRRWNIAVDDSAGEPLVRALLGSLIALLIDAVEADFGAVELAAFVTIRS